VTGGAMFAPPIAFLPHHDCARKSSDGDDAVRREYQTQHSPPDNCEPSQANGPALTMVTGAES
jgi:hypothetical protein